MAQLIFTQAVSLLIMYPLLAVMLTIVGVVSMIINLTLNHYSFRRMIIFVCQAVLGFNVWILLQFYINGAHIVTTSGLPIITITTLTVTFMLIGYVLSGLLVLAIRPTAILDQKDINSLAETMFKVAQEQVHQTDQLQNQRS